MWFPPPVWVEFEQRSTSFSSKSTKVYYLIGFLRGKALVWAEAMSPRTYLGSLLYGHLKDSFKAVFDPPDHSCNASTCLHWVNPLDGEIFLGFLDHSSGLQVKLTVSLQRCSHPRDHLSDVTTLISLAIMIENQIREQH